MKPFTMRKNISFWKERAKWYVKQLLPLTYVSEYAADGKKMVAVWRMWFGRSFNIREWEVT